MYRIKFVGLLIYNNELAGHISLSPTIFEIPGFEKSKKKETTLKFGELLPQLCCPGETLDSQLGLRQMF